MANLRFSTQAVVNVSVVVGRYTPGRPGFVSGPPEDCYPPEPEDVELEAVLATDAVTGKELDVLPYLDDVAIEVLKEEAFELCRDSAEDRWLDQQITSAEARRDSEEDR